MKIRAADLFCGAGGTSSGLRRACADLGLDLELAAVNHWPIAIETHTANHPGAIHLCASVETVDPRALIPSGHLHLLVASPECIHFSVARGGRPVNDQKRASPWSILRWLELLRVDHVLIENVPEFRSWGPIGVRGRPVKTHKGETYRAFLEAIRSLGYTVDAQVLNAADYGDATTRKRLFIQARRGRKPIVWPAPTHSKTGGPTLFGQAAKWRPAREVIDWSIAGQSIFARKRPLKPATMARILAGLEKFGGRDLQPFLAVLRRHMAGRSLDEPLPALTAGGEHVGLAEPFLMHLSHGGRLHSADKPLPTVTTAHGGELGLVEPFLVSAGGPNVNARPVSQPANTVLTRDHMALVEPFILMNNHGNQPKGLDEPVATVTTGNRHYLVEPFILQQQSGGAPRSVEDPLPTIATDGAQAVVEPFLVPFYGERQGQNPRTHSVDEPLPVVPASGDGKFGLVEPHLTKYYGTGRPSSVNEPVPTVTTKDRLGLVMPVIHGRALDIRFRMLQPHELAAAMSFARDYIFVGTREAKVKQIGNAVPERTAYALSLAILEPYAAKRRVVWRDEVPA